MLTHYLQLGDLIQAQIKAKMPGEFKLVADAADLAGVKDSTQISPACHVVYFGAKVAASLPDSSATAWDQTWLTVVVTRSARDAKSGAGARALAGPLLSQLLAPQVLAGWIPTDGVLALKPISPPARPLRTDAGTLYIPIAWQARVSAWK